MRVQPLSAKCCLSVCQRGMEIKNFRRDPNASMGEIVRAEWEDQLRRSLATKVEIQRRGNSRAQFAYPPLLFFEDDRESAFR